MTIAIARRRTLQSLVLALGVTALLGGIATAPARADDDWHYHHEWREHEWREHEWYRRHAYAYPAYPVPGYAYAAPPPVIYAPPPPPPPVFYAPAPALNLIVPIHIR